MFTVSLTVASSGVLEATITQSFMRGANLRRWLKRSDCPEVIRQFKCLFNKSFTPVAGDSNMENCSASPRSAQAHYRRDGVNFSRTSTHLGNSLVLYYPTLSSTEPIAGSIQSIRTDGGQVKFVIQRQAILSPTEFDPFRKYAWFPATVYSSRMADGPCDIVPVSSVVTHVARFNFSSNRAVIVNLSRVREIFLFSHILS
jgi:hypothetical protein